MELTYPQAVNRLKDIGDELERLDAKADKAENRILTEEDQTYFDELVHESSEIGAHKAGLERAQARLNVGRLITSSAAARGAGVERGVDAGMDADPLGDPDSIELGRFKDPWDLSTMRMGLDPEARGLELRSRALSAIERMQGMTDGRRETATRMIQDWDDDDAEISTIALATSSPDYLRAFGKLAKSGGKYDRLNDVERTAVQRAMSLTDANGGYMVPFQLDPTVILTSDGSYNEMRQIAQQVVATADVWNGVSAGAVSWSFDAEASAVSDDTPTFAGPAITIRTARGFVPISLEAYQDAANVTTQVGRLLAQGKDDLEATVFVTGAAGSNQPIGIVTSLIGSGAVVNSTTTDTFAVADVYKIYNALPARYRSRAAWLSNNAIYSTVRGFDTGGGGNLWTQLAGDRPERLLGKGVYEAEAMDGVINALAENYVLIFGDFSNYVIADRIGMTVDFIPQLFDPSTGRPTGQKGWFAHYRVGADAVNKGGFKMLDVT
jgi:HK97 family phage major capsid protein